MGTPDGTRGEGAATSQARESWCIVRFDKGTTRAKTDKEAMPWKSP